MFRISQSQLGFNTNQTDHIMDLVSECFPDGKFRKPNTPFHTESTYEKEFMDAINFTVDALHKDKNEHHENFGRTIGHI